MRELVDRRCLVEASQAQVVLRPIARDVLVSRLRERAHQRREVFLAADLAHVLRREVGVHPRAVPVDFRAERLRMEVDVDAEALAEAEHQVARDPELVGGVPGPLPKIWNSHWPFATSAFTPSIAMPASRQRSMCSSTICRATSPTFLKPTPV